MTGPGPSSALYELVDATRSLGSANARVERLQECGFDVSDWMLDDIVFWTKRVLALRAEIDRQAGRA